MGFLEATRQNIRQASGASLAYVSGGVSQLPLPRVGFLARIHLHVTGTMTITPGTGTAALSELGPWALLRRLRLQIGSGTELWNTSGPGAYWVDLHSKLNWKPENGEISAPFSGEIYQAGVASGANTWDFHMTMPIVPNERDLMGLILLQAEGTIANLLAEWQLAGGADHNFPVVLTGNATAAFVGRVDVYLETFTIPATYEDMPPLDRIHQVIERVDPIFATGDNPIKLLEENTYLRIIHAIVVNGALSSAAVESMQFRYNVTDVPYQIDRQMKEYLQRRAYTKDFPKGIFNWDFYDQGYPNFGGERDLVMASGLAELESLIRIASGTTLGSNNNTIRTVTQQLVEVSVPESM